MNNSKTAKITWLYLMGSVEVWPFLPCRPSSVLLSAAYRAANTPPHSVASLTAQYARIAALRPADTGDVYNDLGAALARLGGPEVLEFTVR